MASSTQAWPPRRRVHGLSPEGMISVGGTEVALDAPQALWIWLAGFWAESA